MDNAPPSFFALLLYLLPYPSNKLFWWLLSRSRHLRSKTKGHAYTHRVSPPYLPTPFVFLWNILTPYPQSKSARTISPLPYTQKKTVLLQLTHVHVISPCFSSNSGACRQNQTGSFFNSSFFSLLDIWIPFHFMLDVFPLPPGLCYQITPYWILRSISKTNTQYRF